MNVSKNCPNLNYEALANSIPVSVASPQVKLQAVGIMQIPIHWGPGAESVFQMLVVPNLTWPILFGESHLHQTDALVDHGKKQVHFRHPNMNFIVRCRNDNPANSSPCPSNNSTNSGSVQLTSQESGANITCLFTGMPGMNSVKHSRQLQKGFNLISICLLISASFLGTYVLNKNFWLEGLQVFPGINIISGPIDLQHASSHLNVPEPEFRAKPKCSPSRLLPPYEEPDYIGGFTIPDPVLDLVSQLSDVLPDFDHQIFYTNVMVHTTHNKASLPYNCQLGKLRLMTDNDKDEFEAAAGHTAEQLSEGWYEFIQSNVSSANNKSPVCNAMSHSLKQWKTVIRTLKWSMQVLIPQSCHLFWWKQKTICQTLTETYLQLTQLH